MKRVLNTAYIGCGAIAQKKHLPLARKHPDIHISMLYSPGGRSARKCRELFGEKDTKIVDDPEEIFQDPKIDLVFIASPNATHAEYAIRALNQKKHVVCEKPMACNGWDAKRMWEAAVRNHRLLHISYQNRFTDQALYTKRLLEEKFKDPVYYAKAYAIRRRGVPTWGMAGSRAMQGGGPLMDIGSHAIDLALWLTDNFEPAYAVGTSYDRLIRRGSEANRWGSWDEKMIETEDCAFGFVVMRNGMTLSIESSYALNVLEEKEASVDLFSAEAGIFLRQEAEVTFVTELEGRMCRTDNRLQESVRTLTPEREGQSPAERELEDVLRKIRCEEPDNTQAWQTSVTASVIDAIYESARTGRTIYFK